MRILHVIGRLDFADGGPPMVATRLAAAQAHLGHEVEIACYSSPADDETHKQLAVLPYADKLRIHMFPQPGRMERLFGHDAAAKLTPLVKTADVVHLHSVWETILLRAAGAARAAGKPYVIVPNGMLDPWSLSQKAMKKRVAMFLAHRQMLDRSALLHLLNEPEWRLIQPLNLKAPSAIIPNGVMLEEFDPLPQRGQFIAGHPNLAGRRFVLFLGRLHFKKGLDYLADAFSRIAPRVPDLDLVVAGPDGGDKENFQNRIAAAGLSGRVHLPGPLYGREKVSALVDCEAFVLPSRQEGFSIAVLEAMAAGAPVVISDQCHFPQVAAAGAGIVTTLDTQAIAASLEKVVSDPNRRRFGKAGRALVESRYTWDRAAEQMIDEYHYALNATAGTSLYTGAADGALADRPLLAGNSTGPWRRGTGGAGLVHRPSGAGAFRHPGNI
jgi:glycosyltransferase involved in cell wall biosynthesis